MQPESKFECPSFLQTLEDLELQYKREAMELAKLRDKEEDDENFKHREVCYASRFVNGVISSLILCILHSLSALKLEY